MKVILIGRFDNGSIVYDEKGISVITFRKSIIPGRLETTAFGDTFSMTDLECERLLSAREVTIEYSDRNADKTYRVEKMNVVSR